MKVLFNLFGRKPAQKIAKNITTECQNLGKQLQDREPEIVGNSAKNIENLTDAVKAKYFIKTAKAANGGETVMKFNKESGKLVQWKRTNPDNSVTEGKINSYLAPSLRISRITNGDQVTHRVKATLGDISEIHNETYDLSQFPKVTISKEHNAFLKGKNSKIQLESSKEDHVIPEFLTKSDYKDLLSNF